MKSQIVKDAKQGIRSFTSKLMPANSSIVVYLLAGINRGVTPNHVTKIAGSILEMGIIRPVVMAWMDFIDGTKKLYIIDGQHLYFALLRYNVDIPYTLIEVNNMQQLVERIAKLNASSKSWTTADYITAWAAVKPSYKVIQELHNTYDISLSQIVEIAHKGGINAESHASGITRLIKKGEVVIGNKAKTVQMLDRITDVLNIVPRNDRDGNYVFIGCYTQMVNDLGARYDHTKFMRYLKTNKDKFLTVTQDTEEITKLLKKGIPNK